MAPNYRHGFAYQFLCIHAQYFAVTAVYELVAKIIADNADQCGKIIRDHTQALFALPELSLGPRLI